jgi:hypothetical protein
LPAQQARVLAPQHRLSDGKFAHDLSEPDTVACRNYPLWPGIADSKKGVASVAYVPAIHAFLLT